MILNRSNVDTTKQPIFLGEPLGLQRYDMFKYPVFMDLFNKQMTFFWRPEEFSLMLDRGQFNDLAEHEKFIFTKNLLFQTMLDSAIGRGVPTFTQHVSLPEVELCLNTWGFFENIHSYSYSYIIQNVYSNPTKILNSALEDKEILARADTVTKQYEDLQNAKFNLKEKIYLSLISVNILEAVRFYISFVCAFAFAENKKMIGNSDVIKLIKRDEACVDKDTEILTETGWIKFPLLTSDKKVAQYTVDGNVEFVLPTKIINKHYSGKMVNIRNDVGHVDMLLTPDHRCVFINNDKISESSAEDVKFYAEKRLPVSAKLHDSDKVLSDYERFLIALQADGSIPDPILRNGKISHCHTTIFSFKKQRKIDRFTDLLKRLGFDYTKSEINKRGQYSFYVKVPLKYQVSKHFVDWIPKYSEMSLTWAREFIEELVEWDGHKRSLNHIYYSSVVESNVIVAQTIGALCGYKTYKFVQIDDRKESFSDVHRLTIIKNKSTQEGQSLNKYYVDYDDNVYCVSVPSGMFLARRNDGIFVTGNCHLTITQTLLKLLKDEPSEGFQDVVKSKSSEAVQMFAEAADEEKRWASYLFQYGSILGLNETILHRYIEWLTDSRLHALGFDRLFGTKNPIGGWTEPYFNSQAVAPAPQETEITQYLKNSTVNDIENMDFGDLTL